MDMEIRKSAKFYNHDEQTERHVSRPPLSNCATFAYGTSAGRFLSQRSRSRIESTPT